MPVMPEVLIHARDGLSHPETQDNQFSPFPRILSAYALQDADVVTYRVSISAPTQTDLPASFNKVTAQQ